MCRKGANIRMQTKIFNINNKEMELPIYQKGDRVITNKDRDGVEAKGTVESTSNGGLFVTVKWDKAIYPTDTGTVKLGSQRMVDGIFLLA